MNEKKIEFMTDLELAVAAAKALGWPIVEWKNIKHNVGYVFASMWPVSGDESLQVFDDPIQYQWQPTIDCNQAIELFQYVVSLCGDSDVIDICYELVDDELQYNIVVWTSFTTCAAVSDPSFARALTIAALIAHAAMTAAKEEIK